VRDFLDVHQRGEVPLTIRTKAGPVLLAIEFEENLRWIGNRT